MNDIILTNSQLTNIKTNELYKEICISLAENVFKYRKMPKSVNKQLLNETLLSDGSIAFFKDDVLNIILALPYVATKINIYNEPLEIQVIMPNGFVRTLFENEFVILWDNNRHKSLYKYVLQLLLNE